MSFYDPSDRGLSDAPEVIYQAVEEISSILVVSYNEMDIEEEIIPIYLLMGKTNAIVDSCVTGSNEYRVLCQLCCCVVPG